MREGTQSLGFTSEDSTKGSVPHAASSNKDNPRRKCLGKDKTKQNKTQTQP